MSNYVELQHCTNLRKVELKIDTFVEVKKSKRLSSFVKITRLYQSDATSKCKFLEGVQFCLVLSDEELSQAVTSEGFTVATKELVKMGTTGPFEVNLVQKVISVHFLSIFDDLAEVDVDNDYICRFSYVNGKLSPVVNFKPHTPKLSKNVLDSKLSRSAVPYLSRPPRSCRKTPSKLFGNDKENCSPSKKPRTSKNRSTISKSKEPDGSNWRSADNETEVLSDESLSDSEKSLLVSEESSDESNKSSPEIKNRRSSIRAKPNKKPSRANNKSRCLRKPLGSRGALLISKMSKMDLLTTREPLSAEFNRIGSLRNGFSRALAMLHVSSVPLVLPCREEEYSNIVSFIEDHLVSGTSGCMYVSGTPGTGKTATVLEAISYLSDFQQQGGVPAFKYIEVNAMKLTCPQQVYSEILFQLKGCHMGHESSLAALENIFLNENSLKRDHVVLLVDELDLLLTNKQDILYNLFEWPSSKAKSKLIIVCIANTMDLPERVMMKRVSSRLGLTRVVFQPYNHNQLKEIIWSRVQSSGVFAHTAVEYAARKMSALSGDARRCLDICRRATEIAQSLQWEEVTIQHITEAFSEMFSSKKMTALKKCSAHEKLFLRSLVSEFRRCGLEEAQMMDVYRQYKDVCRLEGHLCLEPSLFVRLAANLDAMRLIVFENCKLGLRQKVLLNTNVEDVNFAFAKE